MTDNEATATTVGDQVSGIRTLLLEAQADLLKVKVNDNVARALRGVETAYGILGDAMVALDREAGIE